MRLVLDIGNTSVKAALFDNGTPVEVVRDAVTHDILRMAEQADSCVYCSVRQDSDPVSQLVGNLQVPVMKLTHESSLPIRIGYSTPHTLGMDRLAAAVGAWFMHPSQNLLVIDAGTAMTVDFVSSDGVFVGGNISAGASLRIRALHEHTGRLPQVPLQGNTPLFGTDTETAIRSGVIQGMVNEIDGYIDRLRERYPSLLIFLTGGDSQLFENRIKSSNFAEPNLVLLGLDRLFDYDKTE